MKSSSVQELKKEVEQIRRERLLAKEYGKARDQNPEKKDQSSNSKDFEQSDEETLPLTGAVGSCRNAQTASSPTGIRDLSSSSKDFELGSDKEPFDEETLPLTGAVGSCRDAQTASSPTGIRDHPSKYGDSGDEWLPANTDDEPDMEMLPKTGPDTSGWITSTFAGSNCEVITDSDSNLSKSESVDYAMLGFGKKRTVSVENRKQHQKKWDKKHNCKFCNKLLTKLSSHLQRVHKEEPEVAAVLALPINGKERREGFVKLQNEGDYEYNANVLRTGSGCLIPKYRGKDRQVDDCLACPHCKGLYLKSLLSKHISRCQQKPVHDMYQRGTCRKIANVLLPVSVSVSAGFQRGVLGKMKSDDIAKIIRADSLILLLGERLFEKRDVEEHTGGQIASRLRELGRLMALLRKHSQMKVSNLTAALDPNNFDLLISCVRNLAEYDDSTHMYKKGSLALKIGYSVKKCSQILAAEAIKNNDITMLDKTNRFDRLFSGNWYDRISACAAQSVGRARMNKLLLLPTLTDVEKVVQSLKVSCNSDSYSTLARATLALITIFNRKRGGEVQRMKVSEFQLKRQMNRPEEEILEGLTATEKKLACILQRVEIRGKLNRPVPILLTPKMVASLQKLAQLRTSLMLNSRYMFVTPTGENPFRGSDAIRDFAKEAGIDDDSVFTATNLRKQLATLTQAMEVSKLDQDQLANFLGHDIRIHRSVYRQPLEVLQKAKVASVLLRMNRGVDVSRDVAIDSLQNEEILPDDEQYMMEEQAHSTELITDEEMSDQETDVMLVEQEGDEVVPVSDLYTEKQPGPEHINQRKRKHDDSSSNSAQSCSTVVTSGPSLKTTAIRKPYRKINWTDAEKNAVKTSLKECFVLNRLPSKHEAELALAKEPCLHQRTWKHIKDHVRCVLLKQGTERVREMF